MPNASVGFQDVSPLAIRFKRMHRNWIWVIEPFFFLAALISFSACTSQPEKVAKTPAQDTVQTVESGQVSGKIPLDIELPGGEKLNTYEGSMEAMLLAFIQDPNAQPGKDNWFNFNDLNFEFGTDKILPESMGELENIARILKAYPNVKIKIGGYTDKLEDEAENLKISTNRAKAVFAALEKLGVAGQLTGAEGYGSQYAQHAATASEEDRKKDRRISISIRAK